MIYRILEDTSIKKLEEKINQHTYDGWNIHGNLVVSVVENRENTLNFIYSKS